MITETKTAVTVPTTGPAELLACTRCTSWDAVLAPIPRHEGRALDPVAKATVYYDPVAQRLFVTPHLDSCPRVAAGSSS